MSRSTIRVTLIDVSNGSVLGVVDVPPSRLPQRFDVATVLQLGDDNWEVISADPKEAAAYEATGELKLEIRHVEAPAAARPRANRSIDPREMRFSLPSIVDELPTAHGALAGETFVLHEDDYRQIELVHIDALDTVRAEIAEIQRVHDEHRIGIGAFRALHIRRALRSPLDGSSMALPALRSAFPHVTTSFDSFAIGQDPSTAVDDGFAFRTAGGLTVYGIAREGRVAVCGMVPDRTRKGPPVDASALANLRNTHGLLLVDWCARVVVTPTRN